MSAKNNSGQIKLLEEHAFLLALGGVAASTETTTAGANKWAGVGGMHRRWECAFPGQDTSDDLNSKWESPE